MTPTLRTTVFASVSAALLGAALVLGAPRGAATSPSGSPGGFAGDGVETDGTVRTCTSCHSSFALNSGTGGVTVDVPSGVAPGQTVPVTVTVTNTTALADGAAALRQGFEASARMPDGTLAGTFAVTDAAVTRLTFGAEKTVTQTTSGATRTSWTFDWTAPATPTAVTFYAAGNAANGGDGPSGDYIYTATRRVVVGTTAGEAAAGEAPARGPGVVLSAPHPNPVRGGAATLRLVLGHASAVRVSLVDGRGRTVWTQADLHRGAGENRVVVPTAGLAPGLYFVVAERVDGGDRTVRPLSVVR